MATATKVEIGQEKPPYLPFQTFSSFIAKLKSTIIPRAIDKSIMGNLSGGVQSHLLLALRFLGLTGKNNAVQPALEKLVESFQTEGYKDTLRVVIEDAYADVVGDLSIANATAKELDEAFAAQKLDGVMRDRAIRFYLRALADAGVQVSPHLGKRKPKGSGTGNKIRKAKERSGGGKQGGKNETSKSNDQLPKDLIEFPIPIGTTHSCIRVPRNITPKDIPLVQAIFSAVEALAKQNGESK